GPPRQALGGRSAPWDGHDRVGPSCRRRVGATQPSPARRPLVMGRRGVGSTYKRGQTWWIQYCHRGQVMRESSGSTVQADARALLKARLGQLGSGISKPREAERLTFEEMASMLELDYILNERRSLARAKQSLAHLRAFFGRAVAADMGSQQIAAYVSDRLGETKPPAKPATVRRELSALRRMFTLAKRHGRLTFSP